MKRIAVFGTFDFFHPGHEHFFKQAKSLGVYLLVVVARDTFVNKAKGRPPKKNEKYRLKSVKNSVNSDKALLGSKTHNFYRTLRTYKIDTIALGYDQKPSIRELKKNLIRHRLRNIKVVRLKSYKPNIYKSSLYRNKKY